MIDLLILAILIAILVIARVVTVRIRNAGIRYAVGLVAKHQMESAPETESAPERYPTAHSQE